MDTIAAPLTLPFMQRALLEVLLVAVVGGLLGSWIVLRGIPFYAHSLGTAAFPGLVLAGPLAVPAAFAAAAACAIYTLIVHAFTSTGRIGREVAIGLSMTASLAIGVIFASDVFHSGVGVDRLLFGSLIGISWNEVQLTLAVVVVAVALAYLCRRSWKATGFDSFAAQRLGLRVVVADWLLLIAVGAAIIVALPATGVLLAGAMFVVPAATARQFARSTKSLMATAVAIAAVNGTVGLFAAYWLDVPPGPTIAVLGALVFMACALVARRQPQVAQ